VLVLEDAREAVRDVRPAVVTSWHTVPVFTGDRSEEFDE